LTTAPGSRRVGIAVSTVLTVIGIGLFAGILLILPATIPANSVRDALRNEIKAATGLDPLVQGETSVSLFPWGTVSFADVVLGGDHSGPPALVADRVTARLRLLPLLFGRIETADLALVRPQISVVFEASGRSNWSALVDMLARTLRPNSDRPGPVMSFSELRITDGTITVRDSTRRIAETLSRVELSLAWPSIAQSFAATGHFTWREQLVDSSVTLSNVWAGMSGERSGLKVRLNAEPFKLAFDGHISPRPTFKMDGTLAADATSLRQALIWAGQTPLPGGGFGRFALKAQTNMVGDTLALSAVNVELDGNSAEGVLTFTTEGRTALQGTLAADEINLTPYVSTIHLLRAAERDWNPVPIVLDGLAGMDLDLRLSAARIAVANVKMTRTAITTNLRDGRMTVAIGESQAFGGALKGSLGLAKSPSGAEIRSELYFSDVDLESAIGELFGTRQLEGRGSLTFELEASGDSVLGLTRTLNGSVALNARQGAIAGFDVEQLLRRLERRPLSGVGAFRSGRTPFDVLNVDIKFVQGVATLEEVDLNGPAVRLDMTGSASVPSRDLDLKGTATLISSAPLSEGGSAFELPFVVQGPFDDPIILPDPQILIHRSGAAAPLLDAVKDPKTREQVRSTINQLSRGVIPSIGAPAPAGQTAPSTGALPTTRP